MYAIINILNKQYHVKIGQYIKIEKYIGKFINIKILLIYSNNNNNINIGYPYINNNYVITEIIFNKKEKKIKIIKFHRRKHHMKCQGHRQNFTIIKINKLNNNFINC
ncbi:50S ribosomal protein L21 [Candidatus Johnevansia muelleri]|uniref:Large ribosomal subunit protein bL21 n=1 Tax=Candidatus Johnevansia muelleri TaxID=1495769 RepID=A0A078KHX5_9GAMM|nr:50S ribosomal protein L21 [Candidatus Evansia muelleri]